MKKRYVLGSAKTDVEAVARQRKNNVEAINVIEREIKISKDLKDLIMLLMSIQLLHIHPLK